MQTTKLLNSFRVRTVRFNYLDYSTNQKLIPPVAHVRESKTVWDSFYFFVIGTWILDSNL